MTFIAYSPNPFIPPIQKNEQVSSDYTTAFPPFTTPGKSRRRNILFSSRFCHDKMILMSDYDNEEKPIEYWRCMINAQELSA
jgi:hypothetical protein